MVATLLAEIPFLMLCVLVGRIPAGVIIIFLCIVSALEAVVVLLKNYYNIHFVKYKKNGTVAGILNAGMAFSYMIAGWIMPLFVEQSGWVALIKLWPVLIIVSIVLLLFVIKRFKKFKETIV